MPRKVLLAETFQKKIHELPEGKQFLATKALEALSEYFQSTKAPYGLRIKMLRQHGDRKLFEARLSLDLRIVWVQTKEEIVVALLGNHDEVRRFIKKF